MFVLGIDAGGTKTVCQLATDRDGAVEVLAETRGGAANLQASGELAVEKVLHDVIDRAVGDPAVAISAIALGMAGVDRPADAAVVHGILARIGHRARALVVNDALIALEAGAPGQAGLVIVAGTGSIAYGRNRQGHAARAGGWGYLLGDEGSGYWLGRQALRAVVRAVDRRGPPTALTPRVLAHYAVARPQDLIHEIYASGARPAEIASLGRVVQAAADEGDAVAAHLIAIAAEDLTAAVVSVARRLDLEACPIILSGGVFRAAPRLESTLIAKLHVALPDATVHPLAIEPASGAAHLALGLARGTFAMPTYVDTP